MSTGRSNEEISRNKKRFYAKYFGKGCFDCPSFGTEDINLACMMHNTDVDKFVKELNEAATQEEVKK